VIGLPIFLQVAIGEGCTSITVRRCCDESKVKRKLAASGCKFSYLQSRKDQHGSQEEAKKKKASRGG
jgi:hypothetical protein